MRLLLALVLAVAGIAGGCGKDEPTQVVVPGARAGVVLEVSGEVTATRAGQPPRALHPGDVVAGDDEIKTGGDGTVLIELDHNHVTFTLPAGRTQRVSASPAWSQPIAAARPVTTDEHSAAAGRPVERSAVDTSVSAAEPSGGEPGPATAPRAEPAKEAMPADIPDGKRAMPTQRIDPDGVVVADKKAADPAVTRAMPVPPPPPPPITGTGTTDEHAPDPAKPPPPPQQQPAAHKWKVAVEVTGLLTKGVVASKVQSRAVLACFTEKTTMTIAVGADGVVAAVASPDATASACVEAALKKVKFKKTAQPSTIKLTVR